MTRAPELHDIYMDEQKNKSGGELLLFGREYWEKNLQETEIHSRI